MRPLADAEQVASGSGLADVDPDTPLADQMMMAARAAGLDRPPPIADFAIDEFEAEPLLDRVPRPMSRGEVQLCALLITLAAPIDALVVVDPTAGLDGRRRRAVADLLIDLAGDRPVTVASDDPGFDGYRREARRATGLRRVARRRLRTDARRRRR